jgi:putative membrane protein
MKRLIRAVIFYTLALYLTSLIIPGFRLLSDWRGLILAGVTLAIFTALVRPIFSLLILPFNVLTFGIFSFVAQILTFCLYLWLFPNWFRIASWNFAGFTYSPLAISISSFHVNEFFTVLLATFFISFLVGIFSFLL